MIIIFSTFLINFKTEFDIRGNWLLFYSIIGLEFYHYKALKKDAIKEDKISAKN